MKSRTKNFFNSFFASLKVGFYKFFRNFNFDSRTRGGRIFKTIFFLFLYAAATLGIVFGLINLGDNNTHQGLFGKTYNVTYKLDIPLNTDKSKAEDLTKTAAERFTNYLLYKNVITNNVTYSVKNDDSSNIDNNQQYTGYIYVSYTNVPLFYDDEFKNSASEGNFDIDPNKYGLDNQSSNTITAWYFNPSATLVEDKYSYNKLKSGARVFKSSDFDYQSAKADSRENGENADNLNNYGVSLNLTGSSYEYLNDAGLDPSSPNSFKSQYEAGTNAIADSDLQWIVFKDMDHLVNLLNYAKYVVFNYKYYYDKTGSFSGSTQTKWKVYYDSLNSTNSSLVTWATNAINYNDSQINIGVNSITPEYLIQCYEYALGHDNVSKDSIPSIANDGNSDLLSVVKNYVIGAVTKLNYKQWFPNVTSTSSNISGTSVTSFSIQPTAYESSKYTKGEGDDSSTPTESQRETLRDGFITLFKDSSLPLEFYSIRSLIPSQYATTPYENLGYSVGDLQQIYLNFEQPTFDNSNDPNAIGNDYNNYLQNELKSSTNYFGTNGWISTPFIETSVVSKLSTYNSVFLASGVIVLLIAIVVSVLYRIPGMMSAFSVIASFGFALSLLILLKIDVSISSLIGLFIGLIVSVMSISMIMERIRRLLLQKNSVFDSIQTAIKKSMLSTVDLNITIMIIGLSIFFIAKGELTNMGMTLLLSGLLSLGSTFVFFLLPLYSYSTFRFSWRVGINLLHIKSSFKTKLSFSAKKWWIIWGVLIVIILVAGVVFGATGLTNSIYKDGTFTTITLLGNTDTKVVDSSKVIDSIKSALGSDWSLNFKNISEYQSVYQDPNLEASGYYYLIIQGYSKNAFDLNAIQNLVKPVIESNYKNLNLDQAILNNITSYQVSTALLTDIFLKGIYSLLAGWGFLSLYYAIRLNVLTIIPIFITGAISSMLSVSLSYLLQFEVDLLFSYVMIISGIVSTLFSCLFVSVTKTRFVRKKVFEIEKIQLFIWNNIKSLLNVVYLIIGVNVIIFAFAAGLISPSITLFFVNTMIVNIVAIPASFFLIAHLYYYVTLIRQKYVQSIISNFDNKLNKEYKEVDEQLIMGINKFH